MADLDLFHHEDGKPNIEDYAFDNGMHFWYASDVAAALGYDDFALFKKNVLNKAYGLCMANEFPVPENFEQCTREVNGEIIEDVKISRFAFLLTVVSGDIARPQVQRAQAYFAAFADAAAQFMQEREIGERLTVRSKIKEGNRALESVASSHGLKHFGLFHNAGYMGMYNMSYTALQKAKGVPEGRTPLDFMGTRELNANLFRLSETKARIVARKDYGDHALQSTARTVGAEVRGLMTKDGGTPPEALPTHRDITEAQKQLKGAKRELKKIDGPHPAKSRSKKIGPESDRLL
ncbi:MAG TPA: hypothetical protein VGM92_07935 [Candidatus Kapabacteria bacterium]|jgi:DNA-damage-inducible protein D